MCVYIYIYPMASRCNSKVSCHCCIHCIHCDCKYKIQLGKELPSMNPSPTTLVSDRRNRCCKQNLNTMQCSKNNKRQQPEINRNNFYKRKLPCIATVRAADNFQNVSKLCCCATELTIGDLLASSKINKNMNTENIVNKHDWNKFSENFIRCGRCGLKKKKQELTNSENSSSWIIMETLNLMQKIVEEKRQARLKFGNSFSNNCTEAVIRQDQKTVSLNDNYMNYDTDCVKRSQPCLKYSLIVTTNSNCNVSTQTTSSTAIDKSKPQLLKILSEIQDYAQNIQDYFEELNNYKEETCKAAQKSNREDFQQLQNSKKGSCENAEKSNEEYSQEVKDSTKASNYKNTKQQKAKHDSQRICEQESFSDLEHKNSTAPHSCGCEGTPKRRPVSAQTDENSDLESDVSLPDEYISRLSNDLEENDSRLSIPFTSTPRGSRDLNMNAQRNLSRFSLDSDLDSSEYVKLPKQIETSAKERRPLCTNDNLDTVQYQRKMKTIQEKIERLRDDLLSDNNNDSYDVEKEDIK